MNTKYEKRKRRGLKTKAIQAHTVRLVVNRSGKHIYAQIVTKSAEGKGDKVHVVCSTIDKELAPSLTGNGKEQAFQVGKLLASRAIAKEIKTVAFDRSGYKYHGRVKALADGAREAGLNF